MTQRAFVVWFKNLHLWSVGAFFNVNWHWPSDYIKPLSIALERKYEEVDRKKHAFETLRLVTLHFDGEMELRDLKGKNGFKGKLFFANSGDVTYSRIDVRNGAIGVVSNWMGSIAVSSEYPVYKVRSNIAIAQYIKLLFRSKYFLQAINSMISGASGRKRVQPSQIEDLEVPLPPISIQQAIVGHWEKALEKINEANQRMERLKQDSEETLFRGLGFRILPPTPRKGAFSLSWKDLERWDTFFYRKDFAELDEQLSQVKSAPLGQLLNFISRGWNVKDFPEGTFEYVEISSVTKDDGIIDSKTVEVRNAPSRATTLLKEGDIILSTTRPYLGAFAIVPQKYDGCICSSGFALSDKLKTTEINKDFLLFFLKSSAGLRQLERRMTGGLYPAIVQGELEKIRVPIPPMTLQQKIVKEMKEQEMEIAREREKGEQLTAAVSQEVEEMILGVQSVPKVEGPQEGKV